MEIIGVGTDLVEISRFRLAMARRGERLNERLFSDDERAYAKRRRDQPCDRRNVHGSGLADPRAHRHARGRARS